MKKIIVLIVAISAVIIPNNSAYSETCSTHNLSSLFYEDYYPGTKWNKKEITWSAKSLQVDGMAVIRQFTDNELDSIRKGIQSWDQALDSISFKEVENNQNVDVKIGLINLSRNLAGYWYSNWDSNLIRYQGYIKINPGSMFANSDGLVHTIQHEIGNILGLGDIRPSEKIVSVMEDPFQDFYGNPVLGDFDTSIIRQLYGESTCPSSFDKNKKEESTSATINKESEQKKVEVKVEIKPMVKKEKFEIICKNSKKTLKIYRYDKNYPCPRGYNRL